MIDALHIAASGLRSEQKQIDVISNNVANMQTPGFKRSRVDFAEMTAIAPQGGNAIGDTAAAGIRVVSTSTMFEPGELRMTQRALDIAIDGAGLFELEAANGGMVYTRDGRFRVDADGYLASVHGPRLAQGLQLPLDATDIRITAEGEVLARLGDDEAPTSMGFIELASFAATDRLRSIGDNAYEATAEAGAPAYARPGEAGTGALRQGYVEMANVEMVEEMTSLVLAQRAYQLNARVLQASDQVLETINNLRR